MLYSLAVDNFQADVLIVNNGVLTQIPSTLVCKNGVQLLADTSNGGTIYIGNDDVSNTAKGFPLAAGTSLFLPISNLKVLSFIGDADGLKLWWFAT